MAVADFKIQTSVQADRGYDATTSEAITLQLENTPAIDVNRVVFSVIAQSKDAPDLTLSPVSGQPTTPTGTVTFTMPASGFHSYMIQCEVNNGRRSTDRGLVVDAGYTKKRLLAIRGSVTDLRKTVPRERDEYEADGWSPALNELMEAQETGSVGGVDPSEAILTNGAAPSITGAVDVTALASTLAVASTTVQPITVRLNPSTNSTILDVFSLRRSTSHASFGATGIGARMGVELEDSAGNIDTAGTLTWDYLDATSASEGARFLVRLQVAGTLTDVWSMRGATMRVPALGGSGTGFVAVNNDGDLSFALAASATALYLEDATSAVTTNGRPIRNLAAALDFNRANGLPVTAANTLATSGTKIPLFSFRRLTGGVGATSDGGYISFTIPDSGSAETEAARLGWSWQNVTGTYGEVTLAVRDNLGLTNRYTWSSAGKLTAVNLTASALSTAGLLTNDASGNLATSATAVLCAGTVPANLTAGRNIGALTSALAFACDGDHVASLSRNEAGTTDVFDAVIVERLTGDTAAAGLGVGVLLKVQSAGGNACEAARIAARTTTATDGAEDGEIVFSVIDAGTTAERSRVTKRGIYDGPVLWATALKTGTYASSAWDQVLCDPSGGGFTVTVPNGSTANKGKRVGVKNYGTSTNTITIDTVTTNGIQGATTSISTAWGYVELECVGADGWIIVGRVT